MRILVYEKYYKFTEADYCAFRQFVKGQMTAVVDVLVSSSESY